MPTVFEGQLAWYAGGLLLALCVIAIRALMNERLGVMGAFTDVVDRVGGRAGGLGWKGYFFLGLIGGGLLYGLLGGGLGQAGYGWLTRTFDGAAEILIAPVLLVAGILIGFGAKTAGGCTSGNGLSGTSLLSPASLAATATFFATAIAVSFVLEAVI